MEPQVAGNDKLLTAPALQKTQLFEYFLQVFHRTKTFIPQRKGMKTLKQLNFIYCYTNQ